MSLLLYYVLTVSHNTSVTDEQTTNDNRAIDAYNIAINFYCLKIK